MVGVPRGEFFTTDYTDCTDFFIFSREFAESPATVRLPDSVWKYDGSLGFPVVWGELSSLTKFGTGFRTE